MISSGKILSPNVTLGQSLKAKGGNSRINVKASAMKSGAFPNKTSFVSSSFASGELAKTLKVSSSQKLKMTKRPLLTITNGVSNEKPGENLLDYSIHKKVKASEVVKPKKLDQAETLKRGAHYWVENSKLSNKMLCEETSEGDVHCVLPDKN